ncbi:LCP family protein [Streptosporangium lutulentum]|uniref:LCP family glycopolymer transferase n=1 Tax=Streptosporangium lutulentum TaxID=1461250 RepID=UPI003644B646
MRLGQDSGDLASEGGKRRSRRRSAAPGPGPDGTDGSSDVQGPSGTRGPADTQDPPGARGPADTQDPPGARGPADTQDPHHAEAVPEGHRPPDGRGRPAAQDRQDAPGRRPEQAEQDGQDARHAQGAPDTRPEQTREAETRPSVPAPPGRMRFAKPLTPLSLVGWTALSIILPGSAHLRAGRRRTGFILLGIFGALLLTALIGGFVLSGDAGLVAQDGTLLAGTILAIVGAFCWFLLVLWSYVSLRPNRLSGRGQIVSGIVVGVLCVAVTAPFALTASTVLTVKDAANAIFQSSTDNPAVAPVKHEDPWNGRTRVNFLLVGGDGAGNREGVRTDSMNVASVDTKTGNTVLFSLPRNLQHVRFPPNTPLGKQFPNGYMRELPNGGLLNEIWQYGEEHPDIVPGKTGERGPRALMDAIGFTLNLKIDYYALINMFGFAHLVDAIGGLKIRVDNDVKWGGHYGTAGTIKAGYRTLSGEEALWYGRSRVESDDFSRMNRQRCVIGAFAQQATPQVVLTNFTKIAGVAKQMAKTDIPRELLPHLVELGLKVKDAKITSLQFVPPDFWPGAADWQKIRTATARALRPPARRPQAARVTPSPGTSGTTPTLTPKPTRTVAALPSQTPTQNGSKAGAQALSDLCGF